MHSLYSLKIIINLSTNFSFRVILYQLFFRMYISYSLLRFFVHIFQRLSHLNSYCINSNVYFWSQILTSFLNKKGSAWFQVLPHFSSMRHRGFEPRTTWLKVKCSTDWANIPYIQRNCPEPESNQWHEDFQSSALPTELSGHLD